MTYLILFVLILALVEIKARKKYLKEHGVPYVRKNVGEYRYNEFLDEVGPPLHWKLCPGYGEGQVHINSLGLRSDEPQSGRRKIWVVGESELFGAKLADESRIWFRNFQKMLDAQGLDWQVMNASIIGYNIAQATEAVTQLPLGEGDLLLLRPNQNDVSIAYVNGDDWEPGKPWPMAFIHQLQRQTPWHFKLVTHSCFAMYMRKRMKKDGERENSFLPKPGFQWDRLNEYQAEHLEQMIAYADECGARVAFFDIAPVYEPEIKLEDEPKLAAVQANWRGFVEGWCQYQFGVLDEAEKRVVKPRGLQVLKMAPYIWSHPKRYQMFLDLMHFNELGHEAIAEALFAELKAKGFLEDKA